MGAHTLNADWEEGIIRSNVLGEVPTQTREDAEVRQTDGCGGMGAVLGAGAARHEFQTNNDNISNSQWSLSRKANISE